MAVIYDRSYNNFINKLKDAITPELFITLNNGELISIYANQNSLPETDDDFKKTCKLMKTVRFINSYSYIFSPRPGTPASELEMIDVKLAKKRLKIFQKLSEKIKLDYKKKLLNQIVKVLFENEMKNEKSKYVGRYE